MTWIYPLHCTCKKAHYAQLSLTHKSVEKDLSCHHWTILHVQCTTAIISITIQSLNSAQNYGRHIVQQEKLTADREFCDGKIFRWINFHQALFLSLRPFDNITLLHLYMEGNISSLSFLPLKVIDKNSSVTKICQSTVSG